MIINIYTKNNGVGLEADAKILKEALSTHDVMIIDWEKPRKRHCTLGIHLEHIRKEFLMYSAINVLIPNPEWFDSRFLKLLKRIDVVLCKTQDAMRIFSPMHRDCRYIGFTSLDRFKDIEKRREFLHLAGKSSHKNTNKVFNLWKNNAMPPLTLQKLDKNYSLSKKNYTFVGSRIDDIEGFLSSFQFHICPSKAEGFGHYINEALSTGAVVITTDAPPMNELVSKEFGFLVPAKLTGKHNLGNEYDVDINQLKKVIEMCNMLPEKQVNEMSEWARAKFLERDSQFRTNLNNFIKCIIP